MPSAKRMSWSSSWAGCATVDEGEIREGLQIVEQTEQSNGPNRTGRAVQSRKARNRLREADRHRARDSTQKNGATWQNCRLALKDVRIGDTW